MKSKLKCSCTGLKKILIVFLIHLFVSSCQLFPDPATNIVVTPLFTDNMVLQRDKEIKVWGNADIGGEVFVEFVNQFHNVTVDTSGSWEVTLDPISVGGPYELKIIGIDTITIKNILMGDVWICSGQSNMEMALAGWGKIDNYKNEIANAKYSNIRLLQVEKETANRVENNFNSDGWKVCTPETIPDFSAVAYFFGRKLHHELNIPIGLIQTAWGGTVVEAWTSGKTLKQFDEFKDRVEFLENDFTSKDEKEALNKKQANDWPNKIENILKKSSSQKSGFQKLDFNTSNWKIMNLPSFWEDKGLEIDGVVWFSKEINLPASWEGNDLELSLGKINDYDITWFNGERIGRGSDVNDLRIYKIPKKLVKVGVNKIKVQVLDIGNRGGLYGPSKKMKLINKKKSISLAGKWKYKVDPIKVNIDKLPYKPHTNSGANRPTVLYNKMIYPIQKYSIKGAIWYQGESNAERAYQYRSLFSSMIKDWRTNWQQSDFPFYFVQLANFKKVEKQPKESSWAELREAQTMALNLPNTGMAVAIDIGDAKDIHPKNKQDVGKRLALNALAKTYDKNISYSGPIYKSMNIEGNKITVKFDHIEDGLLVKGKGKLKGFSIAGNDKKFYWADAKIDVDQVVVWSSKVKNPVAVRYAWAANPVCNLFNNAGLPASPFRTDNWKGKTYSIK